MKKAYLYISLLITAFILSCSTEKNTGMRRGYHNMTAHFNVLFNGEESFKKGIEKAKGGEEDNFSELLPIFLYSNTDISQKLMGDMDKAIKKSSKAINMHSITAKPEIKGTPTKADEEYYNRVEFNKWVDDCYLLMGKSHLYRQEYAPALESFNRIISKYDYSDLKTESNIWLARTYNEKNDLLESANLLAALEKKEDFPEKLLNDFHLTYADYYIKKEDYHSAIKHLLEALPLEKDKFFRIRYTYILAQLYEKTGRLNDAFDYYGRVIKMNPPYIMTFNAKINRAGVFNSESGDSREIKAQLYKMLKDEKNKEYRDQIYYALGNIAMREGDEEEAINNYKKSAQVSEDNLNQKALTYVTLADIYYERPDYITAQAYYDSALVFLDVEFNGYGLIYNKAKTLTSLVKNTNRVILMDSLLFLAQDSALALKKIDGVIAKLKEEEAEAKRIANEETMDQNYNRTMLNESRNSGFGNTATQGGKWYFYNPSAKGYGQAEFKMKWGTRKLEDNWRRKNKRSSMGDEFSDEEEEVDPLAVNKEGLDKHTREYYLIDIPFSDSAQIIGHNLIQKSLYNVGIIYKNELKEPGFSIDAFKDLTQRYPNSAYALPSYYNLYELYRNLGDTRNSDSYKNIILNDYPDSHYAKLLTDPGYLETLLNKKNEAVVLYEKTLNKYETGNYSAVITDVNFALSKFKKDPTIPKFLFLKAAAQSKLYKDDVKLKEDLNSIISAYPSDDITILCRDIIAKLDDTSEEVIEEIIKEEEAVAKEIYFYSSDTLHFVVFATETSSEAFQLVVNIIDFNFDAYPNSSFDSQSEELNDDYTLMVVRSFKNATEALNYKAKVNNTDKVFKDINKDKLHLFVISAGNLAKLKEDKNLDRYLLFNKAMYTE